jgi:hypothetical protein
MPKNTKRKSKKVAAPSRRMKRRTKRLVSCLSDWPTANHTIENHAESKTHKKKKAHRNLNKPRDATHTAMDRVPSAPATLDEEARLVAVGAAAVEDVLSLLLLNSRLRRKISDRRQTQRLLRFLSPVLRTTFRNTRCAHSLAILARCGHSSARTVPTVLL